MFMPSYSKNDILIHLTITSAFAFMIAIASKKLDSLLAHFQVDPVISQQIFTNLAAAYSSADRHYHNLAHILQILQIIEPMRVLAQNPTAIEFAAWFHDVIYNPKAKDNEEKSAVYAANVLNSLGIPALTIEKTVKIILATKTHQANDDIDTQILLDADLSILGTSPSDYRIYAQAIRSEYAWLPEVEYKFGRKQVLQKLLARPKIYHTEPLFKTLEISARQNIQAEIQLL
jgi:predicted metal-dependent HD superfamily phosphohydrolase